MGQMDETHCQRCGKETHGRDAVHVSGGPGEPGRLLCTACFNCEMADRLGIEFHHPDFEPMDLVDANGSEHRFYFTTRLLGDKLSVEAYEDSFKGYEFQVLGHALDDPMELLKGLVGRMRRALSQRHLVFEEGRWHIGKDDLVRGRIAWDDETHGELPLLVIDGRPVTWREFGRMLMTFEGFQFRLEIVDSCDEP